MQNLKKQALLQWMSKVLHLTQILQIQSLRNGQLMIKLCNKISGINLKHNSEYSNWKDTYLMLKTIMQQLDTFMKNVIKYKFPNAISTMNLVQMAKGQDDQGLINLLQLIFLICFNLGPQNSQIFVQKAIMLSQSYQQQLMDIVKNNQIPRYDQGQMQQFQQKYQKEKEKVKQMISVLQNLSMQNQSLRDALISESQQHKKITQQLKKVQEQKDRMKKQLLQNYRIKDQQQPSKEIMNEHQELIIQQLKSNLMEQQKNYSKQIFQLKQKIQSLQQEIQFYRSKAMQFEQQNTIKKSIDHSNCINRQVYKKQITQINKRSQQASSKQWKMKLQNIKLTSTIQQLKSKVKKLSDQIKNKQVLSGKQNISQLKLDFYRQIRDKLKSKVEFSTMERQKKKQQQENKLQLQDMILDDPQIN